MQKIHVIEKLSEPSITVSFISEEAARSYLIENICGSCLDDQDPFGNYTVDKSDIYDLLDTACGLEYRYYIVDVLGDTKMVKLTDEEEKALNWIESAPDEVAGRITKSLVNSIKEIGDRLDKTLIASAVYIMLGSIFDANADSLNIKLEGNTYKDVETGDWEIIVRKIK